MGAIHPEIRRRGTRDGQRSPLDNRPAPVAAGRVHQILRDRILAKELPAGTLLIELDLSEEFGVSRTTIRSALRELKAERLIEVSPRRGSSVSRMSAEQSMEICMARFALEGADLERVLRADRSGLTARMEDALGAMKDAASSRRPLCAGAGRHRPAPARGRTPPDLPLLLDLWQGLNGQMAALMLSSLDRQGIDLQESVRRHAELIEDFRTMRPAQAVKSLREHYRQLSGRDVDRPHRLGQGSDPMSGGGSARQRSTSKSRRRPPIACRLSTSVVGSPQSVLGLDRPPGGDPSSKAHSSGAIRDHPPSRTGIGGDAAG